MGNPASPPDEQSSVIGEILGDATTHRRRLDPARS